MIPISRSMLEQFEKCNRRGYWNYLYNGRGIERKAVAIPLLAGSLIHEPLAEVLNWCKQMNNPVIPDSTVAHFVKMAQQKCLKVCMERGLLLDSFDGSDEQTGQVISFKDDSSPLAWQINELLAQIEALVKGWVRVRLLLLLDEYEIVDVEQEQQVTLNWKMVDSTAEFSAATGLNFVLTQDADVLMLTRRDALLRRKQTGEFFVLNFKTTSNPDKTWLEQWRYDQQTISEFVAAEQSLKETRNPLLRLPLHQPLPLTEDEAQRRYAQLAPEVVRGVLIEGLVKGQRKLAWPEGADPTQWRHNSPLLYHYATPANPPMPRGYNATGMRTCPEPHKWQWAPGGQCPGNKKHKLPEREGWQRQMVSQTCGFDFWLDWLEEHEPQTLAAQFIALPTILRSDWEVERWKAQTIAQAQLIEQRAQAGDGEAFPMSTASANCLRPSRCSFISLCWGAGDPDDREQFQPREFNHPAEAELVQIGAQK